MKQLTLNKKDLEKALKFANAREGSSSLYKSRGAFKYEDIVVGALAEIGVYKLLKSYGITTSPPDFSIHSSKSFDADLVDEEGYHFHVKGQSLSSEKRYGSSWLMQRWDPILKEPKRKHFLVPCVVDLNELVVTIHGIISIPSLVDNYCIGECAVPSFRKSKVAIYLNFIKSCLSDNSLWSILYRR